MKQKRATKRLGWTILHRGNTEEKFSPAGGLFQFKSWAENFASRKFKSGSYRIVGFRYVIPEKENPLWQK